MGQAAQSILQPGAAFVVSVAWGLVISGGLILALPALWPAMPMTELLTAVYAARAIRRYTSALPDTAAQQAQEEPPARMGRGFSSVLRSRSGYGAVPAQEAEASAVVSAAAPSVGAASAAGAAVGVAAFCS